MPNYDRKVVKNRKIVHFQYRHLSSHTHTYMLESINFTNNPNKTKKQTTNNMNLLTFNCLHAA